MPDPRTVAREHGIAIELADLGSWGDATLVSDAHTTEDHTRWGAPPPDQVIAHTNLYWSYQSAPGRTAGTVATDEVEFAGSATG